MLKVDSVSALVAAVTQSRLLEPSQLAELRNMQIAFRDPRTLVKRLVQRGWFTIYQANQILVNQVQELILGPYRILDLLGEGGVSWVFKAQHKQKRTLAALKCIRPELRTNSDALSRFQQEMRVVRQVSHPHIVQAVDVDPANQHYFAMEFIEGTDLNKLVQLSGPLALPQAATYIRQAALGLQYAYERGLVHRDIKPGNLVAVADGSAIKILDLGLARLEWLGKDNPMVTTLTRGDGLVMGTPDYIAPEQATNPDQADIRADIYSLGYTLFYVLTGQPPYPGGSLAQKLLRHMQSDPPALSDFRTDLPADLSPIIRKMMGKRPEDRHQTPAAVAAAIAKFARLPQASASVGSPTPFPAPKATIRAQRLPTARAAVAAAEVSPTGEAPPPSENGTGGSPSS